MNFLTTLFNSKHKDPKLKLEFEFKGHKFYSWKNFDDMPLFREMLIRLQYSKMELGLHPSDTNKFCEMLRKLIEDGNYSDAIALTTYYHSMTKDFINEKLTIELGGFAYLIDDEPLDDVSETHQELKRKLVLENEKLQFFFITKALTLLQKLSKDLDILQVKEYLTNPMRVKREQLFLKLIQSNITNGLWTGLIPK
jgi:hypothetical protein